METTRDTNNTALAGKTRLRTMVLALGYVADATPGRHTVGSCFYSERAVPPYGLGV